MIRRRAARAGIATSIGCHSFRATSLTNYLQNGGKIETAQRMPPWMTVRAPSSLDAALEVDEGEREAICLAREVGAAAILMDDRKGRLVAAR